MHLKKISDEKKSLVYYCNSRCNVLIADDETANHYALIKTALLQKGKPIPENDMWIAAVSKQFDLKLHTKDKHFKEIDSLNLQSW
ncbi:PIN domain-containing protein [Pedobacter petrophilus]